MVGTWNIRLQEIPDEYTHTISLSNSSWYVTENGVETQGEWRVSKDTLVLEHFTKTHEYLNGQLQIGEKPMKYIITKKGKNNFTAIPFFEKDVDSFVTFVFEKE